MPRLAGFENICRGVKPLPHKPLPPQTLPPCPLPLASPFGSALWPALRAQRSALSAPPTPATNFPMIPSKEPFVKNTTSRGFTPAAGFRVVAAAN